MIRLLSPAVAALAIALPATLTAADAAALATPALTVGKPTPETTAGGATKSLHSWELPALTVEGRAPADVHDDELVGDYGQPRWATKRRFSEVRTYVIPKGQFDFEYWLKVEQPSRKDKVEAEANGTTAKPTIKQMYEAELGLGYRLQVDLYQVYKKDYAEGKNQLDATKFEVRYALADWGKLIANPTVYAEWEQAAEGADSWELKALLCDEITSRWAWATNLVWEQQMGDNRARSQEFNSAIGYIAIDGLLSVGAESNIAYVSELEAPDSGSRNGHWEVAAGPSIRFNPVPQAHIILTQFAGFNRNTPAATTTAILGWEF